MKNENMLPYKQYLLSLSLCVCMYAREKINFKIHITKMEHKSLFDQKAHVL